MARRMRRQAAKRRLRRILSCLAAVVFVAVVGAWGFVETRSSGAHSVRERKSPHAVSRHSAASPTTATTNTSPPPTPVPPPGGAPPPLLPRASPAQPARVLHV